MKGCVIPYHLFTYIKFRQGVPVCSQHSYIQCFLCFFLCSHLCESTLSSIDYVSYLTYRNPCTSPPPHIHTGTKRMVKPEKISSAPTTKWQILNTRHYPCSICVLLIPGWKCYRMVLNSQHHSISADEHSGDMQSTTTSSQSAVSLHQPSSYTSSHFDSSYMLCISNPGSINQECPSVKSTPNNIPGTTRGTLEWYV